MLMASADVSRHLLAHTDAARTVLQQAAMERKSGEGQKDFLIPK